MTHTTKKRTQKKRIFLTGMAAGLLTASLISASAASLSEEEAKQTALNAAGVQEEDVVVHIQKDRDDGYDLYKVKILTDTSEEYVYEILSETGEILESSWEQWGLADGKGTAVSLDDAKQQAAEHAGVAPEDAIFEKAEEERENGTRVWELEFFTEDQKEYEYEIACDTGLILSWSYDGERHLAWKAANPDADLTPDSAQSEDLQTRNHVQQSGTSSSMHHDEHHSEPYFEETHHTEAHHSETHH